MLLLILMIVTLPVRSQQGYGYNRNSEPMFLSTVPNVTVNAGREAVLSCSVSNLNEYKVSWIKGSDQSILSLHKRVITNNKRIHITHDEHSTWSLHIKDVGVDDRDCYMCQINTAVMKKQVGCVDVLVPPDIDEKLTSKDLTVLEGSNATLVCVAQGLPHPKITWRREDHSPFRLFNQNSVQEVSSFIGSTLHLSDIRRNQMGVIFCIANNMVPPAVAKRIMLNVNFSPTVLVRPQLLGIPLGEKLVLNCTVEAYPEPITYWQKDTSEINTMEVEGGAFSRQEEGTSRQGMGKMVFISKTSPEYTVYTERNGYHHTSTLTIHRYSLKYNGVYECVSSNSLGSQVASARVYEIAGSRRGTKKETTVHLDIKTLKEEVWNNKVLSPEYDMRITSTVKTLTQWKDTERVAKAFQPSSGHNSIFSTSSANNNHYYYHLSVLIVFIIVNYV